jgi:hypothetical protein
MLDIQDGWAQAEVAEQARATRADLGWVLHPDHTGHGYATEAVHALMKVAFGDLELRRVTASCFADNEASWRLMERLGMSRETYAVAESLHRSGRWLDSMVYVLLAEEPHDSRTGAHRLTRYRPGTQTAEAGASPNAPHRTRLHRHPLAH